MDLKSRLLEANLPADTVERILESISAVESAELLSSDNDKFQLKIRDLLKRSEVLSVPKEVDLTAAGLKKPGEANPSDTVKSLRPPPSLTDPNKPLSSLDTPGKYADKKRSSFPFFLIMMLLAGGFYYYLTEEKGNDDQTLNPSVVMPKPPVPNRLPEVVPPEKIEEIEPALPGTEVIMPEIPSFRGSWMFMPWDSYISEAFCNDGRFLTIGNEYTVEFWFSKRMKVPGEVNLFEFINESGPVERIFLNDKNEISFTAANGQPVVSYHKPVPSNNCHYHIAMTRVNLKYILYINGNKRIESEVKDEILSDRTSLKIMRSQFPLKGLAIDELRISNLAVYKEDFKPQRILEAGDTTLVYIPFEKDNVFHCYGNKKYSAHEVAGGRWLNVQYEVQQVINSLEFGEN